MLPSFVINSLKDTMQAKALLTKLSTRVKVSFELLQSEYQLAYDLEVLKTKEEKTDEDLKNISVLTKDLIEIQKRIESEQARIRKGR